MDQFESVCMTSPFWSIRLWVVLMHFRILERIKKIRFCLFNGHGEENLPVTLISLWVEIGMIEMFVSKNNFKLKNYLTNQKIINLTKYWHCLCEILKSSSSRLVQMFYIHEHQRKKNASSLIMSMYELHI